MTIRLIANADDYGHMPGVSAGIRQAHLAGIVTSTSVMLNRPGVESALEKMVIETPQLGAGVHLVLTTGRPLLPASQIHTLVTEEGRFLNRVEFLSRLEAIDPDEAAAEWEAQINRFRLLTGCSPDHLDSHHHASYFTPSLFRRMLVLAEEVGCAIRFPGEIQEEGLNLKQADRVELADLLRTCPVPHPDEFIDRFYDPIDAQSELLEVLAHLREQQNPKDTWTAELMCHPGFCDADLVAASSYNQQREHELRALTSPETREALKGIQLIHFGDLQAG